MRRRRNAASSDAAESDVTETPATPISDSPVEPTPADDAPAPETETPARPRTRRRRVAEPAAEEASPAEEPAPAEPSEAEPVVETPARTRRRLRRTTAEETPDVAPAAEAPAPETPSRRRRGRGSVGADTASAEAASPETPVEPVAESPSPEPVADRSEPPAAAPSERAPRRRGGRGRAADAAPAAPAEEPAPTETGEKKTEPGEKKPARTRGLRRTRTVAAPQLMVSEPEPIPVESEESADTEPAEAPSGRNRTRGGRRARPTVVEALPPPEPVRPIYQPLPAEVLARLPETRIAVRKGVAELLVDGELRLPVAFFVNTEVDGDLASAERQIRLAYENGVRLFSVLAHLPWRSRTGDRRTDPLDTILDFVATNAPDALILPRLIFSPPTSWIRAHPDDMTRYRNGEVGDVSLASTAFWEDEADQALRFAVEHVAQGPHAHRILGFYLEHGEWLYEKGVGYDVSPANVAGFRRWLRQRYRNSTVHLQAGWFDGDVTFDNAEIPDWPPPAGFPPGANQFFAPREQRWVDFHEYSSDIVAQVILHLAKAAKEASGGRSAVAVSYGYTLELPRAYTGHLALGTVLASPHVDILTGPISYSGRMPGGSAPPPAPLDSVALAGKLWIAEDDTKTYLASGQTPDGYNAHIASVDGTRAVHARNFGAAIAHGTGLSWMDLWGEGWLDDRETWRFLGGLREIMEQMATRRRNPRTRANADPDVAVIVDERAFFDVRNEALLDHLVAAQRDALVRSGARIGFFLQSDLTRKNFPTSPKLLIFLNAFRLDPAARVAIRERFQDEGRTLAWVFAPGSRDGTVAEHTDVVGMHLRLQPWGSKTGTTIRNGVKSPLTDALPETKFGEDTRVNPSVCVADPRAQALGEYGNGAVSLAVRRHARWQSVFIGEPNLSVPLLRGLYRLAGVPVYTSDDDVCWVGDAMICMHSAPGGGTSVYLPEDSSLHDLVYGETLAANGRGARFSMPPRGTRLLFFGSPAEVTRFGGEPESAPAGLTVAEVPRVTPFVFESASAAPPEEAFSPEAVLFAEAVAQMEVVADKDSAPDEAPVADAAPVDAEPGVSRSSRRRRRRRGRGGEGGEAVAEPVEGDEPVVEEAPARPRPSLEELLPESTIEAADALPPIPDEFLPIDDAALGAAPAPRRRRRRGRGGPSDDAAPETGEGEAPATE